MHPDIFVMRRRIGFAMLRNFGHLISHLYVELMIYGKQTLSKVTAKYLMEYSSKSLIHLSLVRGAWDLFENFDKKFLNVKTLQVVGYFMRNDSSYVTLLEKFPNLHFLKIMTNKCTSYCKITFNVKIHYPALRHLHFDQKIFQQFDDNDRLFMHLNYRVHETMEKYLKEFLKMNTQIENLKLKMYEEWHPSFFHWLAESLPHLEHFSINYEQYFLTYEQDFQPAHFHNVVNFTQWINTGICMPFSFSKLKHLTLMTGCCIRSCTSVLDFILKNELLTTINILRANDGCYYFGNGILDTNIFRLFDFEQILLNVEELSIEGICCNIPADSLLRFLKRNRSLRLISLITVTYFGGYIRDFLNLIIEASDLYEAKIRDNALEITIKRITDGSLMKFLLRRTILPKKEEYENCFEFCNYEKPKFMIKKRKIVEIYQGEANELRKKYLYG